MHGSSIHETHRDAFLKRPSDPEKCLRTDSSLPPAVRSTLQTAHGSPRSSPYPDEMSEPFEMGDPCSVCTADGTPANLWDRLSLQQAPHRFFSDFRPQKLPVPPTSLAPLPRSLHPFPVSGHDPESKPVGPFP